MGAQTIVSSTGIAMRGCIAGATGRWMRRGGWFGCVLGRNSVLAHVGVWEFGNWWWMICWEVEGGGDGGWS